MKPEAVEVRTFAPSSILEKAKRLKENGLYSAALELLQRNSIEFVFYDYFIEQRTPASKQKRGGFQKRAVKERNAGTGCV